MNAAGRFAGGEQTIKRRLPIDVNLEAAEPRVLTRSERVVALTGLGSVAETAALAGAGPQSILKRARIASANATCAIAVNEA